MKFRYLITCIICFVLWVSIGSFGFTCESVFAMVVTDLDFSRRVDWTEAGYPGDIPNVSANVINIKNEGAEGDGSTDDYNAIQSAIDSATPPAVIFFPAGTYRIESQINLKSGIVLRGEGSAKTHLEFLSSDGCLAINGTATAGYVDILSGLEKGSNKIVVSDVSNFDLYQGGEIRQEDIVRPAANWGEYYVGQMVRIVGISGNTLTIDPPLHISLNSSQHPEIMPVRYVEQVGIEDLHIKRLDSNHDTSNVTINRAADCWIRRIESDYTLKYHFSISRSLHLEIRDSYIHDAKSKGDGGQGYGVSLSRWVTSVLVENNIFYELRHSMIVQIGVNGCVFGYNYAERNYSDDGWDKTYISIHGHYPFMNLYEGNIVGRVGIADYWGPSGPGNTFFRNRVIGTDKHKEFGPYRGIEVDDHSHKQNIIGNELTGSQTLITFDGQDDITQGTSTDVLVHGNNVHGTTNWDPTFTDQTLPESFYLSSKPDFFGEMDWPSMGSDMLPLGQGTIPAELRRISGSYVPQPGEPPVQDNCELLGHLNYCQNCGGCSEGQGNCKDDSECEGDGLTCFQDIGAYYGWPVYIDVCESSDIITIITANLKGKTLEVEATSSVQPDAVLTINADGIDYGTMTFDSADNKYVFKQRISDPIENVTVTSNFGGSDTFDLGEGPVCGDTNCDAGEDQCNCASDCGTPPTTETNCSDGIDEDCDTDTDCDDADCRGDIVCPYCGDATCDPDEDQCDCAADCGNPPSTEISCIDGDDNDCDNDIDCDDEDCLGDPACDCKQKGEGCSINGECCSNDCRGKKCK